MIAPEGATTLASSARTAPDAVRIAVAGTNSTGDYPHCAATARRAFDRLRKQLDLLELFEVERQNCTLVLEHLTETLDGLDRQAQQEEYDRAVFGRMMLSDRLERLDQAIDRQNRLILGGF